MHDFAVHPSIYPLMPMKDMNPRPDWFRALQTAVKEPLRPVRCYALEDVYASQGKEKADALVKQKGTFTQRRQWDEDKVRPPTRARPLR